MDENKETKEDCPCEEVWCIRHGNCEECQEYHHSYGQKTCCGK